MQKAESIPLLQLDPCQFERILQRIQARRLYTEWESVAIPADIHSAAALGLKSCLELIIRAQQTLELPLKFIFIHHQNKIYLCWNEFRRCCDGCFSSLDQSR